MATFRVGQKVRIVKNVLPGLPWFNALVGQETEIISILTNDCAATRAGFIYQISLTHGGDHPFCHEDELEPAYDGNEKVSWDALRDLGLFKEEVKELEKVGV